MYLSICIPCFNEEEQIRETIDRVVSYVDTNLAGKPCELILVNDGSTDNTREIIDRAALEFNALTIRAVHFQVNRGRGAAIRAAIAQTTGEYIICLDADLSYDVEHIGEIMGVFEADPAIEVVVVSPYMRGGSVSGVPFKRFVLSRIGNWILSGFFTGRLKTVTCVVRGYRGSTLRGIPLFGSGKELHLEVLRKCAIIGSHVVEIPGRLVWRRGKKSKGAERRKTNVKIYDASRAHLSYALLVRPSRLLRLVGLFLLVIAVYEAVVIAISTAHHWTTSDSIIRSLWLAFSAAYAQSPHTFFIAGFSGIVAVQLLIFLGIFKVLQLQQEETMRHLIGLWKRTDDSMVTSCADASSTEE